MDYVCSHIRAISIVAIKISNTACKCYFQFPTRPVIKTEIFLWRIGTSMNFISGEGFFKLKLITIFFFLIDNTTMYVVFKALFMINSSIRCWWLTGLSANFRKGERRLRQASTPALKQIVLHQNGKGDIGMS